jgi:hypothetical protein
MWKTEIGQWANGVIPFLLTAGKQPHWNLQRVLEGLLIAGITAWGTMYGVQKQLEVEIANIRVSMAEQKADTREMLRAVTSREDRIEAKIDGHVIADRR